MDDREKSDGRVLACEAAEQRPRRGGGGGGGEATSKARPGRRSPPGTGARQGRCRANGEPIGASGLRQVHEVVLQLRGEAGDRQLPGAPRVGFPQGYGAPGGCACTLMTV